jgi:hypothetical protein
VALLAEAAYPDTPTPYSGANCYIHHILDSSTKSEKEHFLLGSHYKFLENHQTFQMVMEMTVDIWWSYKYYKYGLRRTATPVLK